MRGGGQSKQIKAKRTKWLVANHDMWYAHWNQKTQKLPREVRNRVVHKMKEDGLFAMSTFAGDVRLDNYCAVAVGFIKTGEPVPKVPPKGQWPDVLDPPQYDDPHPDWKDPDLPDFKLIWELAREVGYAVGIHGSLKRDVDLIAVPWTDEAVKITKLIDHLKAGLNARQVGDGENKPHGRYAVTLQMDGYFKPIDLSVFPA